MRISKSKEIIEIHEEEYYHRLSDASLRITRAADSASARQLIRLNSLARTYVIPRPEIRGGGR